ncbi:MAG: Stp1/IreP family PP2C-type Ser/Thr phosphatase [Spongiibacteraceae bacterium]
MAGTPNFLNINQTGYTDIGQVRKENEDFFVNIHSPENNFVFTVVADGMGGHTGGAVASELAATAVSGHLKTSLSLVKSYESIFPQLQLHLESAIHHANNQLLHYKQQHRNLADMGTTLVVAVICNKHLLIANVGDSRAYLYSHNKLQQVSKDHSVVQDLIDSGALTAEMARSSNIRNQLTQAVGINQNFTINFSPIELEGSGLILLCSDGLTEYLDLQALETELGRGLPPAQSCHRLIEAANKQGGNDNITVTIVEFGGD